MILEQIILSGSIQDRPDAGIKGRLFSADQTVYFDTGTAWAIFVQPMVNPQLDSASDINYDNTVTGLTAVTVQEALDEIFAEITASGTVTNLGGDLTADSVLLGNDDADVKVAAGIRTDGVSKLMLGEAGVSVGGVSLENATTGSIVISPVTGALGTTVQTVPARSGQQMIGGPLDIRVAKTAGFTVALADRGYIFECTSGTFTIALTAAATLGAHFSCVIFNSGSGVITIDPDSAETIRDATSSAATKTLAQGEAAIIHCNGTSWLMMKFAVGGGGSSGPTNYTELRRAANQTSTSGAATWIEFDTETSNLYGVFSSGSPTRITCPTGQGGLWQFCAHFYANTTGNGSVQYGARLNGSFFIFTNNKATDNATTDQQVLMFMMNLVPTDYLEFFFYQASGSKTVQMQIFTCCRLGP